MREELSAVHYTGFIINVKLYNPRNGFIQYNVISLYNYRQYASERVEYLFTQVYTTSVKQNHNLNSNLYN